MNKYFFLKKREEKGLCLPFGPLHCTCSEGPGPCLHSLGGQPSSSQPAMKNQTMRINGPEKHIFLLGLLNYLDFHFQLRLWLPSIIKTR